MPCKFLSLTVLLACLLGAVACDNNTPLERTVTREQGRIVAEFYTENPENIQFPVKVLFAIDCSLSMTSSDPLNPPDEPYGRRIAAVRRFLDRYNTSDYPSVSFSIMLWSANVLDQTRNGYGDPGFTRSADELNRVLDNVNNDTTTDYIGTLDAIRDVVHNDIINTLYEESGENKVARTKYIVLFFSDGMPNVAGGEPQLQSDIYDRVEAMTQLAEDEGVGQFSLHTFFLSAWFDLNPGFDAERQYAENTLRGMAQRGNGSFREFATAAAIDFINFTDLRLANQYKVAYIMAYNFMVRPGIDVLNLDSDGDGLTDEDEINLHGTDPRNRDTDNDGLSDYFEIDVQTLMDDGQMWPDPLVNDSSCPPPPGGVWPDQDSDGLTDCEESIKGTWRFVADFDSDCMPDGIEVAAGINPFENDYIADSDMDEEWDLYEVKWHTNALANDPILYERYRYAYTTIDHGPPDPVLNPDIPQGIKRYTFDISNISLMDTIGSAANGMFNGGQELLPGDNIIRIYIAQVPEDRPNAPPIFRMAEVTINTLHDDTYTVTLGRDQFELID